MENLDQYILANTKPEEELLHRLERFIYLGDDRQIVHRFCRGQEVSEPEMI